jgi:hypothetical protein
LELRECAATLVLVAGQANGNDGSQAQVRLDRSWALQILSGQVSPLVILERRLGRPGPSAVEEIRSIVGKRKLSRLESRMTDERHTAGREHHDSPKPAAAIYA